MNPYKYSYREFKVADFELLDLLDDEKELAFNHADFLEKLAAGNFDRSICGVAFWEGKPLYIGGYYETDPGVARVFFILDKRALEHPQILARTVLRWRKWIERQSWCHRIETLSLPLSHIDRWMKTMGFVYEGTLKRYTEQGQDYKLWSRVKLNGLWGNTERAEC